MSGPPGHRAMAPWGVFDTWERAMREAVALAGRPWPGVGLCLRTHVGRSPAGWRVSVLAERVRRDK